MRAELITAARRVAWVLALFAAQAGVITLLWLMGV